MAKHASLGWIVERLSFVIFMWIFKCAVLRVRALGSTAVRVCLVQVASLVHVLVIGTSPEVVVEGRGPEPQTAS